MADNGEVSIRVVSKVTENIVEGKVVMKIGR
jgi:hypothetical protein